jgi:hypothetical protein
MMSSVVIDEEDPYEPSLPAKSQLPAQSDDYFTVKPACAKSGLVLAENESGKQTPESRPRPPLTLALVPVKLHASGRQSELGNRTNVPKVRF